MVNKNSSFAKCLGVLSQVCAPRVFRWICPCSGGLVSFRVGVRLTPDFGVVDIAVVEGSGEHGVCQEAFTLGCMF